MRVLTHQRLALSGELQPEIEGVNVALTLVVGVEYPVTAIKRSLLEQARDILKKCWMMAA